MIPALLESAHALDRIFNDLGYQYCIIGGVAVSRWGAPRATLDVDLTLLADFGKEHVTATALLKAFTPRIDNAVEFASMHRVLLVRDSSGTPIDIALGAMPFEVHAVERSSVCAIGDGKSMRTCSAEDLIVHKAFAARPQDWVDIAGILTRSSALHWDQIEAELLPLLQLKEDERAWSQLIAMRDKPAP
jgi:hypothetical protein